MFDWNDLKFFLAVARSGTISGAGKVTQTDHATVGRRITALETSIGMQLFVRNSRGYVLTRQGEDLLHIAAKVETEALGIARNSDAASQALSGVIRVTALEGIGNFFVAPLLSAFAAKHKHLSLELLTLQQVVSISRRDTDIIITLSPPKSKRFVSQKLTDYRLFVYGERKYLSNSPAINCVEDLTAHQFVGYVGDLVFSRELDYLAEIHKNLRARLQYSSLHGQMEAACSGYGLCVLPAFIASQRPELVPVLPETLSLLRTYWIVIHEDIASSVSVRSATDFVLNEARNARARFLGEDLATAAER